MASMETTNCQAADTHHDKDITSRERKRVRDRKAQQEHRKRQKSYIEDLKSQIERMRKASASESLQVAWTENEVLRQKVKDLELLVTSIQSLVSQYDNTDSPLSLPKIFSARQLSPDTSAASTACFEPLPNEASGSLTPTLHESLQPLQLTAPSEQLDAVETVNRPYIFQQIDELHLHAGNDNRYTKNHAAEAHFSHAEDRPPFSFGQPSPHVSDAIWKCSSSPATETLLPYAEVYLEDVLQRARACSVSAAMLPYDQILAHLMYGSPSNSLASDVALLLVPLQKEKDLSTYLGLCWVLYLVLHWRITGDKQAIERLPTCLQPTTAQILVPHSIFIDFLVWPTWRDKLLLYERTSPNEIPALMAAFGDAIKFTVPVTEDFATSVEKKLHNAVGNSDNWSIRKEFFELYPQWESVYLQCTRTKENAVT